MIFKKQILSYQNVNWLAKFLKFLTNSSFSPLWDQLFPAVLRDRECRLSTSLLRRRSVRIYKRHSVPWGEDVLLSSFKFIPFRLIIFSVSHGRITRGLFLMSYVLTPGKRADYSHNYSSKFLLSPYLL